MSNLLWDEETEEVQLKQMMLMDKKMASRTKRDCFFVPIFMSKLPSPSL